MEIPFTSRVVVPDAVLVRGIENESIILNLNNENYYGLNEMGTQVWNALTASSSIQEAFDRLLAEYDVDESTLRADLADLLDTLIQQGVIELHEPGVD